MEYIKHSKSRDGFLKCMKGNNQRRKPQKKGPRFKCNVSLLHLEDSMEGCGQLETYGYCLRPEDPCRLGETHFLLHGDNNYKRKKKDNKLRKILAIHIRHGANSP